MNIKTHKLNNIVYYECNGYFLYADNNVLRHHSIESLFKEYLPSLSDQQMLVYYELDKSIGHTWSKDMFDNTDHKFVISDMHIRTRCRPDTIDIKKYYKQIKRWYQQEKDDYKLYILDCINTDTGEYQLFDDIPLSKFIEAFKTYIQNPST